MGRDHPGRPRRLTEAKLATTRASIAGGQPVDQAAETLGIGGRVDFLGFVSDEDIVSLYGGCRATVYVPEDEDYGYATVESLLARKPVLTCTDSGGPLEFIEDGETGVVVAPTPEALGEGRDRLASLPESRLREMGERGRSRVADLSWDAVVDRLTETLR
jgi:glycosyltransferase involved in cell wall biosynthesis